MKDGAVGIQVHACVVRASDADMDIEAGFVHVKVVVVIILVRLGAGGVHGTRGRRGGGCGSVDVSAAENAEGNEVSISLEILFTDDADESSVLGNLDPWMLSVGVHVCLVRIRCSGKKRVLGLVLALESVQKRKEDMVLGVCKNMREMQLLKGI
jgi:hypothetical protein